MEEESRDEKLLRVLSSGASGQEDWEIAKYLIEKKYSNGDVLLSKMASSSGEILSVVLQKPTAKGSDFIEELRTRTQDTKKRQKIKSDDGTADRSNNKQWHEKPIGIIGVGLFTAVLSFFAGYLIKHYLGLSI
jgi:hypothetical protein